MASLTIPSSPNSFQLRLGFRCRKSSSTFPQTHFRTNSYRRVRCLAAAGSVAEEGDEIDRNPNGNSWTNSDKSNDSFSGWFGADSGGSQRKGGFGGLIGAGIAGVFLAAGLSFASISLSKRSTSGMKPLRPLPAVQQEVSLASDDQDDRVEVVRNEDNTVVPDEGSLDGDHSPESNTDSQVESKDVVDTITSPSTKEYLDLSKTLQDSKEGITSTLEENIVDVAEPLGKAPLSVLADPNANEPSTDDYNETERKKELIGSPIPEGSFSSAGIPAPSLVSAALQVPPGKVLVPAVVDQVQGQAFAALQVLKVIEADVQPGDLCTRREYARWLVSASGVLARNTVSKVYPAMYIENVTDLAFDDITPEDPDFPSIQGLAEAGLISSKLSRRDMLSSMDEEPKPFFFSPESPLCRQDLVSWKMALDKRQLPEVDREILHQHSGFIDIDKINSDAWPALVADLSAGEQGIMALAFGYTRLFQPDKPVTKAQAAIALALGEAADIVSEELTRIEAESIAETAVAAHSALVAEVEKDINATFEKELAMEKEKIDAVEKLAEEARLELERLRADREEENSALLRGRAAIEAEMEVLSQLRHDVEQQLQILMSNKMEISFERERIEKLRKEAESENQAIARLQYELEVERKALSMARAWAEDEAKRGREQVKAIEEARERWERHGIKVVVDKDLQDDANVGVTWVEAGKQSAVETVNRAEKLVDKLKAMAHDLKGNGKAVVEKIIQKIISLIAILNEWAATAAKRTGEIQGAAVLKVSESTQKLQQNTAEFSSALQDGAKRIVGDCKEGVEKLTDGAKRIAGDCKEGVEKLTDGAKRIAGDCREGVGKLTQKFKT
ncbi:uncharacterized protein LOC122086682 isoform X3 [Macadamia integrifolia]|uniref:uncharacterized protein LOC122086682 isoform X3 n=1 Tax=Macadamia integrifolia TaxID=60698 RepID=UPI001C4E6B9F|nr:uncharacterized protein LOC122086682 isoform X3 [Macadamia integrifolia]